jgi:hypothetical protein
MPAVSRLTVAAFALATPLLVTPGVAQTAAPQYHVVSKIAVGKVGDGYYADFIVVDPQNRRLYGLGNTIVDVDQDKVIDSIPGKPAGGYALATDLGKGLARNGTLFDLKTGKVTGTITGEGDASVYDPTTHRAFMLLDTVTVVDMKDGKVIARQHIARSFESGAADGKGKLFINREDSSVLTKVDAKSLQIDARYPIPDCNGAQGLSMDRVHRRLFLGCDKAMVIVNADNGAIVTRIPVAGRADENAFDPGTQLAFSASRPDSTLTIVHEDAPDKYTVVGVVKTGGASRSVAVDEKTHKVYAFYYDASAAGTDRKAQVLTAAVLAP